MVLVLKVGLHSLNFPPASLLPGLERLKDLVVDTTRSASNGIAAVSALLQIIVPLAQVWLRERERVSTISERRERVGWAGELALS